MFTLNGNIDPQYRTSGQVAKMLRISVSTLKRWLEDQPDLATNRTNSSGWRLFTDDEVKKIHEFQKFRRKLGKSFKPSTLRPIDE